MFYAWCDVIGWQLERLGTGLLEVNKGDSGALVLSYFYNTLQHHVPD